jgi:hypothetical protein
VDLVDTEVSPEQRDHEHKGRNKALPEAEPEARNSTVLAGRSFGRVRAGRASGQNAQHQEDNHKQGQKGYCGRSGFWTSMTARPRAIFAASDCTRGPEAADGCDQSRDAQPDCEIQLRARFGFLNLRRGQRVHPLYFPSARLLRSSVDGELEASARPTTCLHLKSFSKCLTSGVSRLTPPSIRSES